MACRACVSEVLSKWLHARAYYLPFSKWTRRTFVLVKSRRKQFRSVRRSTASKEGRDRRQQLPNYIYDASRSVLSDTVELVCVSFDGNMRTSPTWRAAGTKNQGPLCCTARTTKASLATGPISSTARTTIASLATGPICSTATTTIASLVTNCPLYSTLRTTIASLVTVPSALHPGLPQSLSFNWDKNVVLHAPPTAKYSACLISAVSVHSTSFCPTPLHV